MTRIWRYVLADDNGMAPCPEGGMLSLSCCKPTIRKGACVEDWVVGFVPKRIAPGHIAWAGKVAETVPLGDYERRFRGRQDAIYRAVKSPADQTDDFVSLRDDYHVQGRCRDLSGKNALVFDPSWYWGGSGICAPKEIADLALYYVGQSAKNSSPEKIARLEAWLRSVADPGIHGEPRDPRRTRPAA